MQENAKAGNFYRKANDFPRALRLFLQCGDAEVNSAIDVVGEARSEMLTNTLVSVLVFSQQYARREALLAMGKG